jgi:hypothetical protein
MNFLGIFCVIGCSILFPVYLWRSDWLGAALVAAAGIQVAATLHTSKRNT